MAGLDSAERATLVTAFLLPRAARQRKHSLDEFLGWAVLLLQLKQPLYIFVEQELESFVRQHRPEALLGTTKIVIFKEQDLWTSRYTFWDEQWKMDPERRYHSVVAYKVWNEKSEFLRKAASDNSFGTSHFFWIDFGFFRNSKFAS